MMRDIATMIATLITTVLLMGQGIGAEPPKAEAHAGSEARKNPRIEHLKNHPDLGPEAAAAWLVFVIADADGPGPFERDDRLWRDVLDAGVWLLRESRKSDTGTSSRVVAQLRRMVSDTMQPERQRFYAANLLSFLADDAQTIDLLIDAAMDSAASAAFRAGVKKSAILDMYSGMLTAAQRRRMESENQK